MSAVDSRGGAGHAVQPPALQETETSDNLNVVSAASGGRINCVKVTYGRCAPIGITNLIVERARKEPPGTRLALLQVWKALMAGLGANLESLEPQWVVADLDPQAVVTPEDRARAEAAAEEALAPCRVCVVNLTTFLQFVRRVTLATRPSGDLTLVVEVEYNGDVAVVATKLGAWIRESKEGTKYVIPLIFRENLRRLGLEVDASAYDLYLELFRRAEHYSTVPDAYLKPIILQVLEKLRATPFLAKCSRDSRVIYIAAELFRTALWYYDSHIGLGRNQLYRAFRRHRLLASPTTIPIIFYDEYGSQSKKRALAFYVDRLAEFVEYDVSLICRAAAGLEDEVEEGAEQTPSDGGYV
jgi:hypothetical protein